MITATDWTGIKYKKDERVKLMVKGVLVPAYIARIKPWEVLVGYHRGFEWLRYDDKRIVRNED